MASPVKARRIVMRARTRRAQLSNSLWNRPGSADMLLFLASRWARGNARQRDPSQTANRSIRRTRRRPSSRGESPLSGAKRSATHPAGLLPHPAGMSGMGNAGGEYRDRTPENRRGRRRHRRREGWCGGRPRELPSGHSLFSVRIPRSQLVVDLRHPFIVVAGPRPGRDFGH